HSLHRTSISTLFPYTTLFRSYRNKRWFPFWLSNEITKQFIKLLFTHQFFHVGYGQQTLLINIFIACLLCGFSYCFFICVFTIRPTFYNLKTCPLFSLLNSGIRCISKYFICPFSKVIYMK